MTYYVKVDLQIITAKYVFCGLFNDALSVAQSIASDNRIINNKLKRMWISCVILT
jgi:hypothetical protein